MIPNSVLTEMRGSSRLESVIIRESSTGAEQELQPAAVFVFIGLSPNTALVDGLVDLDERGFVLTDVGLQTSLPGVFAAGDCRAGSTKQAASAAGEGAAVALGMRNYLESRAGGMPEHNSEQMSAVQAAG